MEPATGTHATIGRWLVMLFVTTLLMSAAAAAAASPRVGGVAAVLAVGTFCLLGAYVCTNPSKEN